MTENTENNKNNVNLEIERKFLIKQPCIGNLDVKRILDIVQTYLHEGENGSQRRVRRITENDTNIYMYTEKIFCTAVTRRELEYEISLAEYESLINDSGTESLFKRRICFEYKNQMFELDIYPFSEKFAILELELESPEQEIFFPDYIDVVKEVTGDKRYSNRVLGTLSTFPEEVG
ncbi:MAG: hypothetical protein K2N49_02845 [Ruminococcus sp.]|nr:hypothetical protein [Ruminococcus sp.]MDE7225784.1 hypothetical protein [Ruminococcus sp.]